MPHASRPQEVARISFTTPSPFRPSASHIPTRFLYGWVTRRENVRFECSWRFTAIWRFASGLVPYLPLARSHFSGSYDRTSIAILLFVMMVPSMMMMMMMMMRVSSVMMPSMMMMKVVVSTMMMTSIVPTIDSSMMVVHHMIMMMVMMASMMMMMVMMIIVTTTTPSRHAQGRPHPPDPMPM